ncbi:hypothetical protein HMPREF1987_01876 [Peptostreptococcaceae bacterium oral taxon 113 str. W5053]|nr:hypothetical protein HMPREF1987_01876 [Peptostreptococcaceae bacterium oral taxon 113 str. W5053]
MRERVRVHGGGVLPVNKPKGEGFGSKGEFDEKEERVVECPS